MVHLAEIAHWPEYPTMGADLHAAYTAAFAQAIQAAKDAVLKRASELGMSDGKAGKGMAHLAEITHWPEFATMGPDLRAAYGAVYAKAGKDPALKRARDLARNDAKAGIGKAHLAEITQWPEFAMMGPELSQAYTETYFVAYEEVSNAAKDAVGLCEPEKQRRMRCNHECQGAHSQY
jgi:hypothetical protein